jgi:Flp pilus assembly pilin Flp
VKTTLDDPTRKSERGATLVEYALIVAVMALVLSFLVIEFTTIAQGDLTPRSSLIGNPENLTPTN